MNVVNMILCTVPLLISPFFCCGSRGDETVQFAQRGAHTEASIAPCQRGEGWGGEIYCRATIDVGHGRARCSSTYLYTYRACVLGQLQLTVNQPVTLTSLLLAQNSSGFRFCFSDSCRRKRKANRSPLCRLRVCFLDVPPLWRKSASLSLFS